MQGQTFRATRLSGYLREIFKGKQEYESGKWDEGISVITYACQTRDETLKTEQLVRKTEIFYVESNYWSCSCRIEYHIDKCGESIA